MKLKASLKRAARLTLIGLRNSFYQLFGHNGYKKFIIITRSRTGSNLLVSLLDSHPNIEAYGEMFNRLHGRSSQRVWNGVFGYKSRNVKLVGFKIFYYHPQDSEDTWVWDTIYGDTSIPIIHLTRDNTLQTFLSRQIAAKTKVWHDKSGGKAMDAADKRVVLNPVECIEEFERTETWEHEADRRTQKHRAFKVSYEELTGESQSETLNAIQEFLGVEPIRLASEMRKQNTESLEDLIENFEELEAALKGTKWERFLTETA